MKTGRPPAPEKYYTANVYLYKRHWDYLRRAGNKNMSRAVRDLIDQALAAEVLREGPGGERQRMLRRWATS